MIFPRPRGNYPPAVHSQFPASQPAADGSFRSLLLFLTLLPLVAFGGIESAFAQIERPDRKYLFQEDLYKKEIRKKKREEVKVRRAQAAARKTAHGTLPFDINAKTIDFDQSGNIIEAAGDVIITYSTLVAEAQSGKVDIATNEAELTGDVRVSDPTANILADRAYINLNNGCGTLEDTSILFTEGDYRLQAESADRRPGDVFVLKNTEMSTCQCPDAGSVNPWSLRAKEAEITRDGYGKAWNTSLYVKDIPVFYFPYLIFPAKSERQSGLLAPSIGGSSESGFDLQLPFFWAIDRSTDMTVTGVLETETRFGPDVEFRKVFSRNSALEAGVIYFNESARDGKLQGTVVDDLDDPTFDQDRFAGYLDHSWQGELGDTPLQFLAEGRYISDDLFLREYEKAAIGVSEDRFVTSRAVLRAPLGDSFSADLSAEYNQAIVDDDDFVFQRLPQLNVDGLNTFRPFGQNPLGLKLVASTAVSSVNFDRRESYDGFRHELFEVLKFPFFYKNYLEGTVEAWGRGTLYDMDETRVVLADDGGIEDGDTDLIDGDDDLMDDDENESVFDEFDSTSSRLVPGLTGRLGTVVEKVFTVSDNNPIKLVGELGSVGRSEKLVRLKHTLEPRLKYQFVPSVNQLDNPQYDSIDRLAQKNVVTYGLYQSLFARYEPRDEYLYGIEESAPEVEDLGGLRSQTPVDPAGTFGFDPEVAGDTFQRLRRGSIYELARFGISQSFDVLEDRKDRDPAREPLSDLALDLILLPNEYFKARLNTNFDTDQSEFSSYTVEGQLGSKRGDALRSRLRFVDESVRQLESGLEIVLTERVKLGYYSRYDDLDGEFIEQKGGLRFSSSCRCWVLDVSLADRINPDETRFAINVTMVGLGELGNTFFTSLRGEDEESNK